MPESFRAFCKIVSLTAAKTSRMFDVSVACVRLHVMLASKNIEAPGGSYSLWVKVQVRPVHLVESPQQVLGRAVDIIATGVIWEVVPQRRLF